MSEFQNKNDYTVHYYFNHPEKMNNPVKMNPLIMVYVHSCKSANDWVKTKFGSFKCAIIYARRTGRELQKYNFNEPFNAYPK